MLSEQQLNTKKQVKFNSKTDKSFNNRMPCTHIQPFSGQHLKAKQKAYERYKKIYPVPDKENLYPPPKTPYIGFYILKGYKQDLNAQKEIDSTYLAQQGKSSDKIISNILKKYLYRKQLAQMKQNEILPKIDRSLSISTNQESTLRTKKQNYTRVLTDWGEMRG